KYSRANDFSNGLCGANICHPKFYKTTVLENLSADLPPLSCAMYRMVTALYCATPQEGVMRKLALLLTATVVCAALSGCGKKPAADTADNSGAVDQVDPTP